MRNNPEVSPDIGPETQDLLARAAQIVGSASHLVAMVGAGLSVESGIPPYRGPGGLRTKNGEPSLLSYREFSNDPKGWWEKRLQGETEVGNPIQEMKSAVDRSAPNPGHYSLVELERSGLLKCTMTQNVDNLHRQAGSRAVAEIHGNRTMLRCIGCVTRWDRDQFPLDQLPPVCPECGGIVKMDTVMFGEPIPKDVLEECREQTARCDCMLLIGTSGTVKPAAQLPLIAKERGATLIEINPEETAISSSCDVVLRGPSGGLMPLLTEMVLAQFRPISP
jgi:NAD-dependent deacetylase